MIDGQSASGLREALLELDRSGTLEDRLAQDPVGLVHRYLRPEDQEIAALCAAQLAYGRVTLFRPVLEKLFLQMDREGGPEAYVRNFDRREHGTALNDCEYRWTRGRDWGLFFTTLRRLLEKEGSLKKAFESAWQRHGRLDHALEAVVQSLRDGAEKAHGGSPLPRGTRYFLVAPSGGSACKRWMLFLRWMCRPADGVDLGLFEIPCSELLIPLDTHLHRIGRFLGLTTRKDTTWKTALALTTALRRLDSLLMWMHSEFVSNLVNHFTL